MNSSHATEPTIHTDRLDLVHLSVDEMVALFEHPELGMRFVGREFDNPHNVLVDDPGPLRWRVPQARSAPEVNKWFVRLIIVRETGVVAGITNFHGAPDSRGMIEIGLGLDEHHRRQGFATESLIGMWTWAVNDPSVRHLRYTVGVDNEASIGVIRKLGFTLVGQQMDEIDGPEDIYEMSADEFRSRYVK
jgi:ribosomal-protein-alanine N-acetyltransferase